MTISLLLTIALALYTFNHWQEVVLPSVLATVSNTPFQYCYTSTLCRYLLVGAAYCFVFFILIWGSAYLLSNVLASMLPEPTLTRTNWRAISLPLLVLVIYALCWLPGLRQTILGLHRSVMRHLFFPIIPSTQEDFAIHELLKATEELAEKTDATLSKYTDAETQAVERQIHSLVVIHARLHELFSSPQSQLKALLYTEEWSFIDSLYEAIQQQLRQHPHQFKPELCNIVQLCQYYCCHLLVRYWFNNNLTDDQRREQVTHLALEL